MASNITIEILDNAQSARITVPLSAIGATGVDRKANAGAIAEFMGHALEHSGIIGTLISNTDVSNATVSNEHDDDNASFVEVDVRASSVPAESNTANFITLYVKTDGGVPVQYEVSLSDTVDGLKYKIYDKEGPLPQYQTLSYGGITMYDEKSLIEYGVTNGAVVTLMSPAQRRRARKA